MKRIHQSLRVEAAAIISTLSNPGMAVCSQSITFEAIKDAATHSVAPLCIVTCIGLKETFS